MASTGMTPMGRPPGVVGRQVADPTLHGEVHLDGRVRLQRQQMLLGIDDLDVRRLDDVRGRHRAGAALDQLELDGVRHVALEAQLLEVEDDLDDVLLDPGDGAELVLDVADLHGRDGGTLQRGEQHAPQGVPDRHAVASAQRAGLVLAVGLLSSSSTDSIWAFSNSIMGRPYLE